MENNVYIERINYNKVITVKLVIPSGCNAKCNFCYMKDYADLKKGVKKEFLKSYLKSLKQVITAIGDKNPISLDITGNEPTFDIDLLKTVLYQLKEYKIKEKVQRVTITTNGFHLKELIPYFKDVIDYVNISVHDYRMDKRRSIMHWDTFRDNDYSEFVEKLSKNGITTSAVSVIHKPIKEFDSWFTSFVSWCKEKGFIGLRLRCDVFWSRQELFDEYMDTVMRNKDYTIITHENTPDSHWCRLREKDGFRVFFLHGVLDTSILTKGIEYVIADDGKCYCDFYKRTKIEDYEYEVGKIYDLQK